MLSSELSHARSTERLDEHLELLRCYYNFVRPHGALNFGREIRTPAMQAGLTTRRLTFRDIFLATTIPLWLRIEVFLLTRARNLPWCITLDNSKGISRLRFWAKNRRVNGINDLPVFMHQGSVLMTEDFNLCLLFIHPGAPSLISLRSVGTIPA